MSVIKDSPVDDFSWAGDKVTKLVFPKQEKSDPAYDHLNEIIGGDVATVGMTREEMTAKLELVEAKADARLSRFEERMDQSISEMRRDTGRMESSIESFKSTTEASIQGLKSSVEASSASVKSTMITAAVGAVLAIVLGVAAFNATVLSNMVASFESGKSTAAAIAQASEQMKQTQEQLKAIQEALAQKAKDK